MSDTDNPGGEAMRYPQVIRAVRDTPWAIVPGTLAVILDLVAFRERGGKLTEEEIQARIGANSARRDLYMAGSVAILPLYGVLVPRADAFSQMSGGSSVQRLSQAFHEAAADENVSAIVLDVDSPGGQTDMIPEFAAEIRAARGSKPIIAVANAHASSAAYWLGSQANEFVATPSGQVGSIGVFGAHKDISAKLERDGEKVSLISAGKYKVENSPFAPLGDDARAAIQARVDDAYQMFTLDVAKGRRVPVEAVRTGFGEGRVLPAKAALKEGMIDRVATLQQVIDGLRGGNSGANGSHAHAEDDLSAGPIGAHSTATSDGPWDGPQAKANLSNDGSASYYASAFAWRDDAADSKQKGSYKFIHHEVGADGNVGAANLTACSSGIAVLNGGRVGTTIPAGDRQGVYNHLARHLRDGGREPPPLKSSTEFQAAESGLSFADEALALHDSAEMLVIRLSSLAEVERGRLTTAKRLSLSACPEALRAAAHEIDEVLAATDPDKERNAVLAEIARFEARRAIERGGLTR